MQKLDQYGNEIPISELVVLSGENPGDFTDSALLLIDNADWYETAEGVILIPAGQIENILETAPSDAGVNVEKEEILYVARSLHRWNKTDGFYHA